MNNKCNWCGKEYHTPGGCAPLPVKYDGVDYIPVKFGAEPIWEELNEVPQRPCHDCGVMPGEYHHCGCDVEACPVCGGQFLTCEHSVIEDPEDDI